MTEKFPYHIFEDLESNQYFDRLVNEFFALTKKVEELEQQIKQLRYLYEQNLS